MTEKDGTPDTVSLPPTYAPSEAYTESPPPAYRGIKNSKVVQIVKLVCVTAVIITLLTGFFILSSHYLKTRACTCDPRPLDSEEGRAALLQASFLHSPPPPPSAQALVGKEEKEINVNKLDAGDDPVLGDDLLPSADQVDEINHLVEEVVEAEKELEEEMKDTLLKEEEQEEAALRDILNAQADHMKKIRLPVDLILGNPDLAGHEVNCEVERRQVPIAPGVLSQTILVTCKDDNNNNEEGEANPNTEDEDIPNNLPQLPNRGLPRPPLSLIAPLMKMLTSRPGPQPRLIPVSLRGPIPIMSQPRSIIQQVPMRSPFPLPVPNQPRMTPIRGPISISMPRMSPKEGPSDRMLPRHLQPIVRLTPRVISRPREEPRPVSLLGLQRGALPVPQARARAPPSPVSLSPIHPRFPQVIPMKVLEKGQNPFAQPPPPPPQPATHMEMNVNKPAHDNDRSFNANPLTLPRMEFGPPKVRTLISGPRNTPPQTRIITLPKAIRVHTINRDNGSPLAPPPPPPPPRFAEFPRRSPNPPPIEHDAEAVPSAPENNGPVPASQFQEARKHHLLMMN